MEKSALKLCSCSVSAEWMIRSSHAPTVFWRAQVQIKASNTNTHTCTCAHIVWHGKDSNYSVSDYMLNIWKASYGCIEITASNAFTWQNEKGFLKRMFSVWSDVSSCHMVCQHSVPVCSITVSLNTMDVIINFKNETQKQTQNTTNQTNTNM